jgi:23S rRNA (guanine745-N1)-methyltransferase
MPSTSPERATSTSYTVRDAVRLRAATALRNCGTGRHLDAVAATVAAHVAEVACPSRHVLDAGSGTGHHLAQIAAKLPGSIIGLGLDISKDAARLAARSWPMLAFAVADVWATWPMHDAAVDLVVSIFAPRNFPETARVLRPGGWLALAYPGSDHLIELRDRFGLLRQHEEKPARDADMVARFLGPPSVTRLFSRIVLTPAIARAVILMGPNARHVDPASLDAGTDPLTVTFDINILFARKSERS